MMLLEGTEFFGKVKDKAGEMEKKMKEKDKHGKDYDMLFGSGFFMFYDLTYSLWHSV